jgi:glycosyltransferase involved in cell wall biosynthesis
MILLVSANFPPEPVLAASLSKDLAEALSGKMKVRVLTPIPSRPSGFIFDNSGLHHNGYEHILLDSFTYAKSRIAGRLLESYSFGKHASDHIKKNHDLIHCCYVSSWPLFGQYIIIKTLKRYSIPSVVHIQDIYPESLSNKIPVFGKIIRMVLLPLDKYILRNCTRVVAISKNMCNIFIQTRGLPGEKIDVIQNWRSEDEFLRLEESKVTSWRNKINEGAFVFMYLGNLGPVAGVDTVIRSFANARIGNSVLVIAGSGQKKKECVRLAESFQLSDIKFWDVPAGEVPAVQEIANVMLLPVKKGAAMSSVPSKLIAYMFSKKPVIACVDEKSDTEIAVKEADCGWIVPPENLDELADMMKKTASMNREDLTHRGENGFRYAIKNYSARKNINKLVSIIMQSINSESF